MKTEIVRFKGKTNLDIVYYVAKNRIDLYIDTGNEKWPEVQESFLHSDGQTREIGIYISSADKKNSCKVVLTPTTKLERKLFEGSFLRREIRYGPSYVMLPPINERCKQHILYTDSDN